MDGSRAAITSRSSPMATVRAPLLRTSRPIGAWRSRNSRRQPRLSSRKCSPFMVRNAIRSTSVAMQRRRGLLPRGSDAHGCQRRCSARAARPAPRDGATDIARAVATVARDSSKPCWGHGWERSRAGKCTKRSRPAASRISTRRRMRWTHSRFLPPTAVIRMAARGAPPQPEPSHRTCGLPSAFAKLQWQLQARADGARGAGVIGRVRTADARPRAWRR